MVAALQPEEFSGPAVNAIATLSGGIPRTVNLLCERSLDLARRRRISPINTSIVRQAARQLEIPSSRPWFMNKRTAVVASVLLAGGPPATWLCASQSARMTPAAAVAPVSAAPSTAVPDRAVFGAGGGIPGASDEER